MPDNHVSTDTQATIVLIHGAWAGGWVWSVLQPMLEAQKYCVLTLDLPGSSQNMGDPAEISLEDCVAAVESLIENVEGPLFLVGHSGGGVVATQVAQAQSKRVTGLIFLAAMMLPSDTGFDDIVMSIHEEDPSAAGISPYLSYSEDGLISEVPIEAAAEIFLQDLPEELALTAAKKLGPQCEKTRFIKPSWTADGFGRLPRLYIEASLDRSVTLPLQRIMQSRVPGAERVTLEAGHVPQVSQPEPTCKAICSFIESIG